MISAGPWSLLQKTTVHSLLPGVCLIGVAILVRGEAGHRVTCALCCPVSAAGWHSRARTELADPGPPRGQTRGSRSARGGD